MRVRMTKLSMTCAWLVATLALALLGSAAVTHAQGAGLHEQLLAEGGKHQVIQFNPEAALQKRVFADGFVPNSAEFSLRFEGVDYAAQRAEQLSSGRVRVYYVAAGDWGNVRFVERGNAGGGLGEALLAMGEEKQVLQFNPNAALQKIIFAQGFVPNSTEFGVQLGGVGYTAQRAESLVNGQVRVYYVAGADWGNVRNTAQTVQAQAQPGAPQPPVQPPASAGGGGSFPPNGSACPANAPIKGNRSSSGEWIYHMPGQQAYNKTIPEECFDTPEAARAAGYRPGLH